MYKQNHPDPAQRELIFQMTKADGTPDTGLSFASGDLQLRKPRAFGAAAGSSPWVNVDATQRAAVVELGNGSYIYTFTQDELDTPGPAFAFKAKKGTGQLWINVDKIEMAFFGKAVTGTLTTSAFTSDRPEATNDFFRDGFVEFLSGGLIGQVKKIGGYTGSSKLFLLATGFVFTAAPANGDVFEFINR